MFVTIYDGEVHFKVRLEIQLGKPLCCGGSKCAYELTRHMALILPNRLISHGVPTYWQSMAEGEVEISTHLSSYGLLTANPKLVTVQLNDMELEAYIAKSFSGLADEGVYVLDMKKPTDSFPKNIFIDDEADLADYANWEGILRPLIEDILTLAHLRIRVLGDNLNYAITKAKTINLISEYEVRYFGFDLKTVVTLHFLSLRREIIFYR